MGCGLVLGVRLVWCVYESLMVVLGVICVCDIDDGVGVGGGAGSAHRSLEVGVVTGVRVGWIVEGDGVGSGAASVHSSCGVVVQLDAVGVVVVRDAAVAWDVMGVVGVKDGASGENMHVGVVGVKFGDEGERVGVPFAVVVNVVVVGGGR